MAARRRKTELAPQAGQYDGLVSGVAELLEQSRRTTARTVNSILTATYWEIGRRIVEFEQGGEARAEYGTELLKRLGKDLTARFGRGFGWRNLFNMRNFHLGWEILQTPSAIFKADAIVQTPSGRFEARVRLPAGLLESMGHMPAQVFASRYFNRTARCGDTASGNLANQTRSRNTSGPTRINKWLSSLGPSGTKW